MATLFYYKYSASMFLKRSRFKGPTQIFTKKRGVAVFYKDKQA